MPSLDSGLTHGPEEARASVSAALAIDPKKMPDSFPLNVWNEQAERYQNYWDWFTGVKLAEHKTLDTTGETAYKFPLHINSVRTFARKHAAVLFGEAPDGPDPLVKTRVTARLPLKPNQKPTEEDDNLAQLCQNIANEVWANSNGRAIQQENGTLSQFLGGCVFQACWLPKRTDLRIPIVYRPITPDFFLPIWDSDDYWHLREAFIVYNIPAPIAARQYNREFLSQGNVVFVDYWTRTTHSTYLDGEPLTQEYEEGITEELGPDNENPFGFVPFIYIPHLREGASGYGQSIVDDMTGLLREYNGRLADLGDAFPKTIDPKRYMSNTYQQPTVRDIGDAEHPVSVIDLGPEPPTAKNAPSVWTEDPPSFSVGVVDSVREVWNQMLRSADLAPIAFGEDEGSQRSALTLELRMWPITAHARAERSFWEAGLNTLVGMMLQIVKLKQPAGIVLPDDYEHRIQISQDWAPMVPRGRKELIDEIAILFGVDAMSIEQAIEKRGDVRDPEEEKKRIEAWMKLKAETNKPPLPFGAPGGAPKPSATQKPKSNPTKETS